MSKALIMFGELTIMTFLSRHVIELSLKVVQPIQEVRKFKSISFSIAL